MPGRQNRTTELQTFRLFKQTKLTAVFAVVLVVLCLGISGNAAAYGDSQWDWTATGVSGTFPSRGAAFAALKAKGGHYAFLDTPEGSTYMSNQDVYYTYSASPRDPQIDTEWDYYAGILHYPSESALIAAALAFGGVYSAPECPARTMTPRTAWAQEADFLGISIREVRHYDDNRYSYAVNTQECIPLTYNYTIRKARDASCEWPLTANVASQSCITGVKGTVKYRPNVTCDDDCTGNPVVIATGNKTQRERDISSPALSMYRQYHSRGSEQFGSLGIGWIHNFESKIIYSGGLPVGMVRSNGFHDVLVQKNIYSGGWTYRWLSSTDVGTYVEKVGTDYVAYTDSNRKSTYDGTSGRLLSIANASGQITNLSYDSDGNLETVTGPFGHQINFYYDAGKLDYVTNPAGQTIDYSYDGNSNLVGVAYPDGTARSYQYGDSAFPNHLTGVTDENSDAYKSVTYDSYGRAVTSELAGGAEKVTLSYSTHSTTVTDAIGTPKTYDYTTHNLVKKRTGTLFAGSTTSQVVPSWSGDKLRRPTEQTDENGNKTKFAYDNFHLTSRTEAFGTSEARVTTYQYLEDQTDLPTLIQTPSVKSGSFRDVVIAYNANKQPTSVTINGFKPDGTAVSRSTTITYDVDGNVATVDGPRTGVTDVTTFEYYSCTTGNECGQLKKITNALGHITNFNSYDAHGRLTKMTDANGLVSEYAYDLRGRVTSLTQTPSGGTTRVTSLTYDDAGQLTSSTSPEGVALTFTYNAAHQLTKITDGSGNYINYAYDLKGNQIEEKVYDSSHVLQRSLTQTYDLRNNIDTINNGGSVTDLLIDAVGNLDSETDPNLNVTDHSFDALNRLTSTLDALSGTTSYDYDVANRLIQVDAPNGATTTYEYGDLGSLLKEISPDRGTTTYAYDAAGNLTSKTDARSVTTTYQYDALNRLTSVSYPDSTLNITLAYDVGTDQKGFLTSMTDGSGSTTYSYDAYGNLLQQSTTIGSNTHVTNYEYDKDNQVTATIYPSSRRVDYTRDSFSQITAVDSTVGGVTQSITSSIAHEPFGPIDTLTFGNGLVQNRNYDQAYRVEDQSTGTIQNLDYVMDSAGNITTIIDLIDSAKTQVFQYDTLNRIDDESGEYGDKTYTYDANGNRTQRVFDDGSTITTQTLAYSANSNQMTTRDGLTITLDANGNTTADPAVNTSFDYGDHNRMLKSYVGGVLQATYSYNSHGQRVKKIEATGSQRTFVFHYDQFGALLGETVYDSLGNKATERDYVWLGMMPLAQQEREFDSGGTVTGANLVYLQTDQLFTPRLGTDSGGTVVWRWDSDAFGQGDADTDPDGDLANTVVRLRFSGQYRDGETGLNYNYFRDYDPITGRYVQSDPIGLVGGLNTYGYVLGNPLRYADPNGLQVVVPIPPPPPPPVRGRGTPAAPEYWEIEALKQLVDNLPAFELQCLGVKCFPVPMHNETSEDDDSCPIPDTTRDRTTKGNTDIRTKPGDEDTANDDFDDLDLKDVNEYGNGIRVGWLPDGSTVIVRPSRDGRPTIEIQNGGRTRIEVRYGPKE